MKWSLKDGISIAGYSGLWFPRYLLDACSWNYRITNSDEDMMIIVGYFTWIMSLLF